ncbi:aldehyde dehydrogenase family protein [Streptomyces sp. F63]|uniref:aldehyde dehydrogenase family protein n=1 Tax=Streptomyces sp. F63 TaxID=2824887 RepID=UPI001B35C53C|nr:aldehyde dehydrogenase family protein [Streptomyces sp. F63]MBQ0985619.1 aldehyde dehydrogenase family protein [Streptomyces sp. F63]
MASATPTPPAPYSGFDRMFLAGHWQPGSSGSVGTDTDPYTDETLTEIQLAAPADVDLAYGAAREAQPGWAALPREERAAVLDRAARIMADRRAETGDWLTREAGATAARVDMELGILEAVTRLAAARREPDPPRVAASVPGKENLIRRRPVGIVAVISPWNFPAYLSNRSVAPALAAGNAVVLKPAGDTPVTGGLLLARIYEEAGLPPGLLSVLVGSGGEIGDLMVAHHVPRVVSFTGSTPVGRRIAARAGLKKLALELGGNGPMVVLDDAGLDGAVDAALHGSYFHQGQICMATNRVIVDRSRFDDFTALFTERARALRAGDPRDGRTQLGPLINDSQLAGVRDKVARAVTQGARVVLSGEPAGPTGRVLPPHVVIGRNDVATAAEEVFGPVATLLPADGEEDALRLANDTEYGLSSAVFTGDPERGLRFASRVEAGMTHVNDTTVHDDVRAAFGGEKQSGLGRFGGEWVFEEFTTPHWVTVQRTPRDLAF